MRDREVFMMFMVQGFGSYRENVRGALTPELLMLLRSGISPGSVREIA